MCSSLGTKYEAGLFSDDAPVAVCVSDLEAGHLLAKQIPDDHRVAYDAPRFRFKLLSKGPGIPLPFKSKLFADINVYKLKKLAPADS